jgi:hypothetical protein
MRPGFIRYEKADSYPELGELRDLTRFVFDAGTVFEYRSTPHSSVRFDLGSTFVRYLQGPDPKQPPISTISSDYISNQGNLQLSVGYIYRF